MNNSTSFLLKGSFIILAGNFIASFINYLYHPVVGKFLSPSDYGLLESLIALSYFIGVFTSTFSFVIIHIASRTPKSDLSGLIYTLEFLALKFSFIFWLFFLMIFPLARDLLRFQSFWLYFLFILQTPISFLPIVYLSILRAEYKFLEFSAIGVAGALVRLIFSLFLILLGYKISGAIGGLIASGIITVFLGFYFVKRYWKKDLPKKQNKLPRHGRGILSARGGSKSFFSAPHPRLAGYSAAQNKVHLGTSFWRYALLCFMTSIALISIYSSDILLVRFYFSSEESGIYSAVAILGKIIFFAATAILAVTFPFFANNTLVIKNLKKSFWFSVVLIGFFSLVGALVFWLFPGLIIRFTYNYNYLSAAPHLVYFAIFMSFFALLNLVVQFLLALNKKTAGLAALAAALSQIVLIIFRHQSLSQVIENSIISTALGLIIGLVFVLRVVFYGQKN